MECCLLVLPTRIPQVTHEGPLLPLRSQNPSTAAAAPGPRSPPGPAASLAPPAPPSLAAARLWGCTLRTHSLSSDKSACGPSARTLRRGFCIWRTSECGGIPSQVRGYTPGGKVKTGAGGMGAPAIHRERSWNGPWGQAAWSCCCPSPWREETECGPMQWFKCSHSSNVALCGRVESVLPLEPWTSAP